jgi:hypothetical protein
LLPLLLGLASIGCVHTPTVPPVPPEPTQAAEPLPGAFHLTSAPESAPYPLTVRIDDIGGPSRRAAEFEEGDQVVVDWSTLPLPPAKWIEVNGNDCEGTFGIRPRSETDLLLILADDGCRVQVLGVHAEGASHLQPDT